MNRSILIVICDFLVLSVLSLSSGIGRYQSPVPVDILGKKQVVDLLEKHKDTNQRLIAALKELADTRNRLDSAEEKLGAAETRLSETRKRLGHAKDQLKETERQLAAAKGAADIRGSEFRGAMDKYKGAVENLAETRGALKAKEKSYAETKDKLEDTQKTLNSRDLSLAKATGELADMKNRMSGLVGELADAKAQLQANEKRLFKTETTLSSTQEKLNDVEIKYAGAAAELGRTKGELNMTLRKLSETSIKYNEAVKKLFEAEGRLDVTFKKLASAENRLDDIKNKLARAEGRLSATLGQLEYHKGKLEKTENKLSATRNLLSAAEQELSYTEGKLENRTKELSSARERLDNTERHLSQTKGVLTNAVQELSVTREKLEDAEERLKSDVLKKYAAAVLKLTYDIVQERWIFDHEDSASCYLPQITLGDRNYIVVDFRDMAGMEGSWVRYRDVIKLDYSILDPRIENSPPVRLKGPALSLDLDNRVCLLPVPAVAETPLYPISFEQLKKRGLRELHLFKKNSFGRGSTDITARASINLEKGDNYLYINNRRGEPRAEIGDTVLTKEGNFVAIVVDLVTTGRGLSKKEEAKCFVFPSKIYLNKSVKIPFRKENASEEYYKSFARAVDDISKKLRNIEKSEKN